MIYSIRNGFATNSSSTHHIVYCDKPEEKYLSDYEDNNVFGWDLFTLADPIAKCKYFGLIAFHHYNDILNKEDSWYIAQKYFPEIGDFKNEFVGIDHQSLRKLPLNRNKDISELWGWFRQLAQNEKIYILGGNDNDYDNEHPIILNERYKFIDFPWVSFTDKNDCELRVDSSGFITVFNKNTGRKIRTKTYNNEEPISSDTPELVDLSITDYCEQKCEFCYKNSNINGQHADIKLLNRLIYEMNVAGVFEIAIGGGDPTTHPNFKQILYDIRRNNIVPSFSTRSLKWLDDQSIVDAVKANCGAVAFSVKSKQEAVVCIKKSAKAGIKPSLHFVLGCSPLKNLENIIRDLSDQYQKLIILGFKNIGRGENFVTYPIDGWIDLLNKYKWNGVGVDASLAEVLRGESNLPSIYLAKEDGIFSMYYDAVENTASHNSFSNDKILCENKNFKEVWMQIRKTQQGENYG